MKLIIKAFTYEYFKELKKIRKDNIIFFNGVFDIVHKGHIKMINDIKRLSFNQGNALIICGLNSDLSVSKLKKSHPLINNEQDRAELLLELGVDYVFIFDEETPTALIMNITPDMVVKGKDYQALLYDEKEFLISTGTNVKYIDIVKGQSTTNIYNKIYKIAKADLRRKLDEA